MFAKVTNFLERYGRYILLLLGLVAVFVLVRDAGPEAVLDALWFAAPYLPAIFILEVLWISMDIFALKALIKADLTRTNDLNMMNAIPWHLWVKSAVLAYGIMIFLPAGRAGGEVARARMLTRQSQLGGRVVGGAIRLQAATLMANTLITIPCLVAVYFETSVTLLFGLLLVNGLATLLLASGILFVARRSKIGAWMGGLEFMKSYVRHIEEAFPPTAPFPLSAVGWTTIGRCIQTLQYGVVLLAVGGVMTMQSSLISQGIHLVGSGLGDMIPNAVGITEAAYSFFAGSLGLQAHSAAAISIALIIRLVQYTLATGAILVGLADKVVVEPS